MSHKSGTVAYKIPILPVRYARHFFQFMESQGIPRSSIVNELVIKTSLLDDPDFFLSMQEIIPILTVAKELLQDERAAFQFGQSLGLVKHGLLGYDLLHQKDVKNLVASNVEHIRSSVPLFDLKISYSEQECKIQLDNAWDLGELTSFVVSIYMGSIHTLASLISKNIQFMFAFPSSVKVESWKSIVGNSAMVFSAKCNQVTLDLPGQPLNFDEEKIEDMLVEMNSHKILDNHDSFGILSKVRFEITRNPGRNSTLERVASQVGMTPRSVRRHLNIAGFSFQDVRNDVRETFATRYLVDTNVPLGKIAERLGYSDQASFTKAYRSWTGKTPGKVRRHALTQKNIS